MQTSRYDQIMKTFAGRLRAARKRNGYKSAQSFALAAGLDPHAYRKYERGETEPNFETLVRVCELLAVTTDELLPVNSRMSEHHRGRSAAA